MITCVVVYLILLCLFILRKAGKLPRWPCIQEEKYVFLVLFLCNTLALAVFLMEVKAGEEGAVVTRGTYGSSSKTEEYELTAEDVLKEESVSIDIGAREYTGEEIQALFKDVFAELDTVILGENSSLDRVERDLNLATTLETYPVEIQWELDSYDIMNIEGKIQKEDLPEEGTLVKIQGTVSYGEQQAVYVRHAMVYPLTRTGKEELLYKIEKHIREMESETRGEESFRLPEEVDGVALEWQRKSEGQGYYILLAGIVFAVFLLYRKQEESKREKQKKVEELLRDYPGMVSKFSMLISTGMTVRNAWERIAQNYDIQKEQLGRHTVYEEMKVTALEMQSGVSEAEAYERFGRRCEVTLYVKFGTLLSQNLRKGSRGLAELLRMEAIQSFEERKSTAKKLGEEASTKLLVPMLGMLLVVLIMVMIPAFLSMQI